MKKKQFKSAYSKAPSIRICFGWKRRCFSPVGIPSTIIWCGRKRRFSKYDDVIRHILLAQRMLLKACYRIYIILAFSCVRAKTIQIRYVWMFIFWKTEKCPFSKIPGYVWTGPKYNMTQRKSCLTCQRKPFAMLINGLGAVFQENYHGNFAESIICCEPHDLVSHRWWKIMSSLFTSSSELFNKAWTRSVVMCKKTILYKGYVKCISLFSRK